MLSSVLHSSRAVQLSITIVRAFVKLREVLATHKELARKMEQWEAAQREHGQMLVAGVEEIRRMKQAPRRHKPAIGFDMAGR